MSILTRAENWRDCSSDSEPVLKERDDVSQYYCVRVVVHMLLRAKSRFFYRDRPGRAQTTALYFVTLSQDGKRNSLALRRCRRHALVFVPRLARITQVLTRI